MKKNTQNPLDASKDTGLEVNTEKIKYVKYKSLHQNTEQNHDIKIGNKSTKNVTKLKYLRNCNRSELRSRRN
jgi:hypothetical protein